MTRDQEILARAMSHVDDELIAAAHAPRKKLRHYMPTLIAACLCVVIVAAFPFLRTVINMEKDAGNDAPAPSETAEGNDAGVLDGWPTGSEDPSLPPPALGDTITVGGTRITLADYTDTTATLRIVKTDDTPLYMAMRQRGGGILASTEPGFRDNGTILRPAQIKLFVNGATEWVDDLPHGPGEYHVLVDYSTVTRTDYVVDRFLILYSYTGEENTVVAQDLHFRGKPADTDAETE